MNENQFRFFEHIAICDDSTRWRMRVLFIIIIMITYYFIMFWLVIYSILLKL